MRAVRLAKVAVNGLVLAFLAGHLYGQQLPPPPPLPKSPNAQQAQNQFDFANGLYQRQLYLEAAEEYANFIRSYPHHEEVPTAMFRRAECLYQASYENEARRSAILEDAEQQLRILLERFPQNDRRTEALLRRGEILYHLGRSAEAIPVLEELLRGPLAESVEEEVRFFLAESYWEQKQRVSAEKEWETLRLRFPRGRHYAMATYSLALLKWQKAQPNAAITLLNELLVENPRFPIPEDSSIVADARVMLAEIYAQLGDYSRAERLYREVSNDPRHRIAALFGRAWALFKQGRSDETASLCRKLLVEPGLGERAAGTLFLLGAALYEARKYQEAIDPLRRAVVHPDIGEFQTQAWFRLVWSLFLTGDQERAAREAKRLLKLRLDPALAGDVHFVLAQIAAASSRYETAATEYRTVVDQYPASRFREKAAFGLGQTEYLLRAYDRAARAFEAFIEEYPDSPLYDEALRWLVESLVQIGEHEEAAVRTAELLQRNPAHKDLPRLLYSQGLSLYKSGRIEEMCGPLEKLLDRFPQSRYAPEALYWLAWHDDQAGNTDQAIQEFERLVKEYPKSGYLYAAYRRLIVGYIEREKFDQALPMLLAMLSNADEVKVIGAEIFFRLAIYASDQGRHEDAVRILTAVAEIHPNPSVEERALIERGRELIWMARWQEALDCAERLLSKYPQTLFLPEAHWVRARAFNGMDRLEEAAEAFDDSLQSLVNVGSTDRFFEATVHLDRGKLLEARGMIEEALKEYLYVDILFPGPKTSPQAILRGADIQKRLGKEKEARQMLERLVQTYPNAPEAQQARLRLRDLLSQAE